ncbi:Protein yceI precursor [Paramagnetospirillum magnetotacticum MS-1]|uniref:Protein yceI n=1 Tax=Paramagnetospirillum magnetotacticum MS-1 TaxID=272627 RepID=A0A0C2UES5_PARME|nr:YceI family protein [Paramagnetospirillum magnetotacticum]KIM00003.1 Protein yceI precursor [Paramagnetospirillum magnetotacticum MS-1]
MKLATAVLFAAAIAIAAPARAEISSDPAKLEGGQFMVDKSHAKIIFSFSHFGLSTSYGQFTDFDAKLNFDPKTPAHSAVDVTINMDGIHANVPKFETHLKSPDFFDVATFPTATFKSTSVEVTGPTTGKITGNLTVHGITRPVVLDTTFNAGGVHPMNQKYVVGFSAKGLIKRSDFGVGRYAPNVGDEVTLTISAEFIRQ